MSLSAPHPTRRMRSDLGVEPFTLMREACTTCGFVRSSDESEIDTDRFDENYTLYAHAPTSVSENERQRGYADWIASSVGIVPDRVFEAGAGNGSFALALRDRWPKLSYLGIEPAPSAAFHARAAGIDVRTSRLTPPAAADARANLALSINVIEHVPDPTSFLTDLASWSSGTVAVVCPDGDIPGIELLISDHLHSFTQAHMRALFHRAQLRVVHQSRAPHALGSFFITVGVPQTHAVPQERFDLGRIDACERYLQRWATLDETLSRALSHARADCFGCGEAAGLLRAYAPKTWSRIDRCVVDVPGDGNTFFSLPIEHYAKEPTSHIVLGVRPQDQSQIAARLEADAHVPIRWDYVIALAHDVSEIA